MEIFQLLDKSNCRECGEKTCLAFAGAVFTGGKQLSQCPKLDPDTIARFSTDSAKRSATEQERDEAMERLQAKVTEIDLAVIHVNAWVAGPFFDYVLYGKGLPASGNWASFRELKDGKERYPLFQKRCEEPMKKVADTYTDLFDDLVHIFSGRQVEEQFESDISVVLHPLPRIPMMVCYWKPEDGLASSLNLFFDKVADDNLDIGSVFSLGAGMAQMFEKLAQRHGFPEAATFR
jgi:CO dehydrogenase/acetyl-CoA synthase gamma subunit (corrinoid Fe-S protein)